MSARIETEALMALIADSTGGEGEAWILSLDADAIWSTCGSRVMDTDNADASDAELMSLAKHLAVEVLEHRQMREAVSPAMSCMYSSAKAVFDDYELTIDHFGDLAARQSAQVTALEAEIAALREGRDYGC